MCIRDRFPTGQVSADLPIPSFQRPLEFAHEFAGVGAVDGAVIKAKAVVLHRANGDSVVAFGVGEDYGLLAQAADGKDCLLYTSFRPTRRSTSKIRAAM